MRRLIYLFTFVALTGLLPAAVARLSPSFTSTALNTSLQAGELSVANGDGTFFDSGQLLGNANSHGVALGDLNGDGHVDAFVANGNGPAPNRVWLNNGSGQFSGNGQALGNRDSQAVALGDLDGDGDLDAVVANSDGLNQVWLNDGTGQFSAGQAFDGSTSRGVALGDLNGNGRLDAFFANGLSGAQPDEVWFNDGNGVFTDSGQALGSAWSYAVALGDLTGNGYIDAFTASWFPNANKVWLNNGSGTFTDSGQNLGSAASLGVSLGDVNGNGYLDAVVANNFPDGLQVWLNDGSGVFSDSGQTLGDTSSYAAGLADLDGDGDLDIFAANFGPNRIWFNGAPGLPGAVFDVERTVNDDGDDVTYWATSGNAMLPILLSRPATEAVEVHVHIETATGTTAEVIPFSSGQQVKFLNVVNPQPNPSDTADLTLSVTLPGNTPGPGDVTDRLKLVFVDGDQGMKECIFCYVEWLGRLVGIDSIFGAMHHVNVPEQEASPQWDYYTGLFGYYSPELAGIVATNPSILWASIKTLDGWTPAVQSLSDGGSGEHVISGQMAGGAESLLNGIKAKASPGLQAVIQQEQNAVDVPSLAGMSMNEAWSALQERRPISQLHITIVLK